MKRQRASLGELCSLVKGTSPISKTSPGPYTLVTTGEKHKTADSFQLDVEAVCIPLISSTGHGHASLKRVHYYSGKFALANLLAAAIIKDRSVLSASFLTRYLMFTKDRLIVPLMTGAANMSISLDRLATVPIDYPTLVEQERIVKLLDEADEMRKLRAKADNRTTAILPSLFHRFFGDETSENAKPLGDVCHKITDGVHITPTYVTDGIPFLRVTDIQEEDIPWNNVKRIPESEYEQITKRGKPEQGDVLYSKNGTIGIAKEITWERPFTHFVSLAVLKPDRKILNPTFLTAWLNTPDALKQAVGRSKTGTVSNLHLNEIRKMRIPCPPMETQIAFVGQVTKIREMEAAQSASRHRLEALFQSMLHRGFNGEL